ncbi:hypothetical protein IMCC20628_04652 (plasmid) [Hoeflea sp. IMCC20628]|nr:hypothetical protein IMCC20628_04652 [Hoeflea sp. IMCC20628]
MNKMDGLGANCPDRQGFPNRETDIEDIVWMLNSTPRKYLGLRSPTRWRT